MFVKTLKIFLSLMALAIVTLIFLFVTGTCQDSRFLKEKFAAVSADKAIIIQSRANTGAAPTTIEREADIEKKAM